MKILRKTSRRFWESWENSFDKLKIPSNNSFISLGIEPFEYNLTKKALNSE